MFTEDDDGYVPIESTMSLANGEFKVAGEIFASAIVQGGPGPWVFISTGLPLLMSWDERP